MGYFGAVWPEFSCLVFYEGVKDKKVSAKIGKKNTLKLVQNEVKMFDRSSMRGEVVGFFFKSYV